MTACTFRINSLHYHLECKRRDEKKPLNTIFKNMDTAARQAMRHKGPYIVSHLIFEGLKIESASIHHYSLLVKFITKTQRICMAECSSSISTLLTVVALIYLTSIYYGIDVLKCSRTNLLHSTHYFKHMRHF